MLNAEQEVRERCEKCHKGQEETGMVAKPPRAEQETAKKVWLSFEANKPRLQDTNFSHRKLKDYSKFSIKKKKKV